MPSTVPKRVTSFRTGIGFTMGVSENKGYLFGVVLYMVHVGYYIRAPYFRKPPQRFRVSVHV